MYNLEEIKKVLPHRDPFLFLDEVTEMSHDDLFVVAKKTFNPEMDIYKGHFPKMPITPGVIILEAMAQAGAFLVLSHKDYVGKIAYFAGADNVKWRAVVNPGDTVVFKVFVKNFRHGMGKSEAFAYVDDVLVCQAIIKVAVR